MCEMGKGDREVETSNYKKSISSHHDGLKPETITERRREVKKIAVSKLHNLTPPMFRDDTGKEN